MANPYAQPFNPVSASQNYEYMLLYKLTGADMNITTDQPIQKFIGFTSCIIHGIYCTNASISLTTAAGGIYTAASKGGTAVVAAAQAYSGLTTSALAISLTVAVRPTGTDPLYLNLTTGQGAAATADFFVYGTVLS